MKFNLLETVDPLTKRVMLANWGLLGLTIVLETVVFAVQFGEESTARIGGCIAVLGMLCLLSIYWPKNKSRWFRLSFCMFELALVATASALGVYRWIWPLYLVLIARSTLLLDPDDLPPVVVAACVFQFGWYFFHAFRSLPQMFWLNMVTTAMFSGLMMTTSTCLLVLVVAVLMRTLVSEQQLRVENEILATELERTRIAREIHDTVGHSLTSLKIQLELAGKLLERGDDKAREAVTQAEHLAARSLTDTRVALQSIRNADFDFEKAVAELVRELKTSGAVQVKVECQEFPRISNAVSYQLYRVIQECLTNTLKHAQAGEVVLNMSALDGRVTVEVRDDGKGFDSDATTDGFGLKGLRERIASLNGAVLVNSKRGEGTSVKVTVPLS